MRISQRREIFLSGLLRTCDRLVNHHSRCRFSVLFLLRRVNAMGVGINGKAVDSMLDAKVFQLTVVVWIILMENRDSSAVTRDIDAAQTGIKFYDIGTISEREKCDRYVLI